MTQRHPDQPVPISSMRLFLCRLGWFLLAPIALFAIAVGIGSANSPSITMLDLAYWLVAVAVVALRWLSFVGGDLTDAFGEPSSTIDSIKAYSVRWLVISAAFWGIVKGIAAF